MQAVTPIKRKVSTSGSAPEPPAEPGTHCVQEEGRLSRRLQRGNGRLQRLCSCTEPLQSISSGGQSLRTDSVQSTGVGCMMVVFSLRLGRPRAQLLSAAHECQAAAYHLGTRPKAQGEVAGTGVVKGSWSAPAASALPWATGAADPPETLRSCCGVSASTARGVPAPQKSTASPVASSAAPPCRSLAADCSQGPSGASGLVALNWRVSSRLFFMLPVGTGDLLAATKPESTRTRTGVA